MRSGRVLSYLKVYGVVIGDLVEVVLFGGEVEAGHGGAPGRAGRGEMIAETPTLPFQHLLLTDLRSKSKLLRLFKKPLFKGWFNPNANF